MGVVHYSRYQRKAGPLPVESLDHLGRNPHEMPRCRALFLQCPTLSCQSRQPNKRQFGTSSGAAVGGMIEPGRRNVFPSGRRFSDRQPPIPLRLKNGAGIGAERPRRISSLRLAFPCLKNGRFGDRFSPGTGSAQGTYSPERRTGNG